MNSNMTPVEPIAKQRGNYVLLTADGLRLVLPQHEVGTTEYLDGVLEAGDEPGLLKLQGLESALRFAALSTRMTLLPHCPSERFLVTSFRGGNEDINWCWNELKVLINVELQPQALPAVLLTPDTPVEHYVEIEGKLAFLCSADQLRKFALAPRY
jgi:hypothetical protein